MSEVARRSLEAEGRAGFAGVEIEEAKKTASGVTLRCGGQDVSGSALLISAGRQPNVENLNLSKAGVAFTKRGVTVDEYLEITPPGIYAVGDILGELQFTHVADYHARLVIRNTLVPYLFLRQKVDYSVVPWCTYLEPKSQRLG